MSPQPAWAITIQLFDFAEYRGAARTAGYPVRTKCHRRRAGRSHAAADFTAHEKAELPTETNNLAEGEAYVTGRYRQHTGR